MYRGAKGAKTSCLCAFVVTTSEQVFQRELHDARIVGRSQLSEGRAREFTAGGRVPGRCGEERPEAVGDVIDFPSKLEALTFLHPERPHECHVEIEVTRTRNLLCTGIADRSQSRVGECRPVEPESIRTAGVIADLVSANIVRELIAGIRSIPSEIVTSGCRHVNKFASAIAVDR